MENKKYLTEENYERGKKKIKTLALIILVIGLLIGGGLILIGIKNQSKINYEYSEENKLNLSEKVENEKNNLQLRKNKLEAKGIQYKSNAHNLTGDEYELYYITKALDVSFNWCSQDEFKSNTLTSKYCSLKNELLEKSDDFNKSFDNGSTIPFYIIGAFVLISTCMIAGYIYLFSKGREITAYTTQQVMPVAKEGIEEMAPTVGKAAGEIAKGIKEGLKDEDEK